MLPGTSVELAATNERASGDRPGPSTPPHAVIDSGLRDEIEGLQRQFTDRVRHGEPAASEDGRAAGASNATMSSDSELPVSTQPAGPVVPAHDK